MYAETSNNLTIIIVTICTIMIGILTVLTPLLASNISLFDGPHYQLLYEPQ